MSGLDLVGPDRHLASIHLRVGALLLARAELEALAARDLLDPAGLADLAEARWRTGDLERAAESAIAHLDAGGDRPVARVIAAEGAAAAGRAEEARAHVAALGALSVAELGALFAGMPQRAFWPSAPPATVDLQEAATGASLPGGPSTTGPTAGDQREGLWPEDERPPADRRAAPGTAKRREARQAGSRSRPGRGFPDAADVLSRARDELRGGNPERIATGLDRLALVLRLDPTLAPGVIEAVVRRQEPAALLIRGDACRILGRTLEAEAALVAAAALLDRPTGRSAS
jgi:hypothetical protein